MEKQMELPEPLLESDLHSPRWSSRQSKKTQDGNRIVDHFEMYYVETFGWVICTLHIRNAGRHSSNTHPARTYAIAVKDGKICRVGLGPHVKRRVYVYVTQKRKEKLQKFLDLKQIGEANANNIRDRISTRRLRTSLW